MREAGRTWRTLIRIELLTDTTVTVVVPGWNPRDVVELPVHHVPLHVRNTIDSLPFRCDAKVNLGADTARQLRFETWELAKTP